ncbi:MAG: SpoIIE family protein phosphatase [Sphaerochaetaceae bacterium]|nr:SpoIIE family protein phosphatase [Sphaerochaetaceae bacterium]
MKKTIAGKLTFKLIILISAVMVILIAGSYQVVSKILIEKTMSYNISLTWSLLDTIWDEAIERHIPIDIGLREEIDKCCAYICKWYPIDYVYVYSIRKQAVNQIDFLGFAQKNGSEDLLAGNPDAFGKIIEYRPANGIAGAVINHVPTKEERLLTEIRSDVSNQKQKINRFYPAYECMVCIQDDGFGNIIIAGSGISEEGIENKIADEYFPVVLAIMILTLLMAGVIYYLIRNSIFKPVKKLAYSMTAFITDGKRSNVKLDDSGEDEFALIASSFNKMSDDIDKYMHDINRLTGNEERRKTELSIASRIQQGFLASPRSSTGEYEIAAKMTPAKDVGGDLYDYLDLGNGRLLLTVGDVSGKGLSASFSMAVTLVLIRQFATMGFSPAEILEKVNDAISERNPYMMFVTIFVGVFDKNSGLFTYANAGHNVPYILREKPERLNGARNLLLGLFKNEKYFQEETHLDTGETLFLYTDGVNEATDTSNKMFGEKRLENVLNGFRATHEENLVKYVYQNVTDFTGEAEQSDDITMLAFTVKKHTVLELLPIPDEFDRIKELILGASLPRTLQLSLCVAAEEIFTNICSYAFSEEEKHSKKVCFTFEHYDRIMMRFEDEGVPYDPTKEVIDAGDYDPDKQIGGLGKLIAFTIADSVTYENKEGKNILTITKYMMEDK